jgi:Curlin associated repeat
MKKIILSILLMLACIPALAVDNYDIVATAYLTTTISQSVVFDSTMQQGGTFTFSVLAHNGGGRAGQSDTANVKIQFYTAANVLVSQVNSSYSSNLPQPTQSGTVNSQGVMLSGNPQADPAVPWSTLTISSTNCGGSCANVSYAKVSMYGVDGSYWAGDYGPWYRAPTFTITANGTTSGNLLYNPEFGPYNGTNVQGWTVSPALGACQGAWGGSNACIVDSSGTPGINTTGLVANQNGGGPSSTGGTTSGQPGGYNNAMSVNNPNPQPVTLVSSTTTYTTQNLIVGNQWKTISTPTTVNHWSDGTTTTTSGTASSTVNSNMTFTGVHFGASQVADAQWDVGACTQTNTCNIYYTSPGVTYNTGSATTIGSNQYITFIPNTDPSTNGTDPWTMILVNPDGTYTSLGNGHVLVQGTDSNGYIYLFFCNDYYNGTLFSGNLGLQGGESISFTGTANPSVSDTNTLAGGMSTNPLVPGQSGGNAVAPTVVSTSVSYTYTTSVVNGVTYVYQTEIDTTTWSDGSVTTSTGATTLYSTSTTTDSVSSSSSSSTETASSGLYFPINTGNGTTTNLYDFWASGSVTTTTTTTTITPVTTTTYADGTVTTSNGNSTISTTVSKSYNITPPPYSLNGINPFAASGTNAVYINVDSGSYSDSATLTQEGNGNLLELYLTGESNSITMTQGTQVNRSVGSGLVLNVSGNLNIFTAEQIGLNNSSVNSVVGNNNSNNISQNGNTNQSNSVVSGNGNTLAVAQNGNSNFSTMYLAGEGNSASVTQTGNNNNSLLNLTNFGGVNTVTVNQIGNNLNYVLNQVCYVATGCGVSITQH